MKRNTIVFNMLFLFIAAALLLPFPSCAAELVEADNDEGIYTDGYDILFEHWCRERIVKEVYKDGDLILSVKLDEHWKRIEKWGATHSTFELFYPEYLGWDYAFISREIRDGKEIVYHMDFFPRDKSYEYTGFCVDGKEYSYVRTEGLYGYLGYISGIANADGVQIAKYVYGFEKGFDGDCHTAEILEWDFGQEEWVPAVDDSSIAYYNKIRYLGDYEDDETGWIYARCGGYGAAKGVIGYIDSTKKTAKHEKEYSKAETGVLRRGSYLRQRLQERRIQEAFRVASAL